VFAVQLARLAGARVIGTESATSADALRALGAEPVAYRDGLVDRLRALAPADVTAAIDLYGTETEQAARELSVPDERITTIAAQVDGITACAIHHQRGYPHPLLVRQLPVTPRGSQRAVPHRAVVPWAGQRGQRLGQQASKQPEVPASAGTPFRLEVVRVSETGDQVRVHMLGGPSRAVQITQKPAGAIAAEHFPDHGERSGTLTECSAVPAPPPGSFVLSPAGTIALPEASQLPGGRSNSAGLQPDSGSFRSGALRPRPGRSYSRRLIGECACVRWLGLAWWLTAGGWRPAGAGC
jgi:hypothetical protein